jgi:hypothetical protein
MKSVPAWLVYSVLRVLMFAVPLAGFLLLGFNPWLATVLAAIIGFCLSYIFLRKPRDEVAEGLYRVRHRTSEPVGQDEEAEDAAGSERESSAEQDAVAERGETGELKRKD